jgi:hypothetical protein
MNVMTNSMSNLLQAKELGVLDALQHDELVELALPETGFVSLNIPDVIEKDRCSAVANALRARAAKKYDGAASGELSIASGNSAWDRRFNGIGGAPPNSSSVWQRYFDEVSVTDRERRDLTEPYIGEDILNIPKGVFEMAGAKLEVARHPHKGRRMEQAVFRNGAAGNHFDWAATDLSLAAVGHIGLVIPLATGPSPVQRVWDHFHEPDEVGNYGYPIPLGTPYIDVPTPVGSICLLSARRTHAVLDSMERITFAFHIALLADGRWVYYA